MFSSGGPSVWFLTRYDGEVSEPREGSHTWPEMNSSILTVVEDEKVPELLHVCKKLDNRNLEMGVRAFVWNVEQSI